MDSLFDDPDFVDSSDVDDFVNLCGDNFGRIEKAEQWLIICSMRREKKRMKFMLVEIVKLLFLVSTL